MERLQGIYRIPITDGIGAVGAGEEPDNPNEFVRSFETPPIQKEAADEITALRARVTELEAELKNNAVRIGFLEGERDWYKNQFEAASQRRRRW